MKRLIAGAALVLSGCASMRIPPLVDTSAVSVCSTWSDANGSYTLPDPCRYEVTPGEWLIVRHAQPKPEGHSRLWWLMLALLI